MSTASNHTSAAPAAASSLALKHGWRLAWPTTTVGSRPRGIVVVLGWWFGEMKHLEKYGAWWAARGFAVIQIPQLQYMLSLGDPSLVAAMRGLCDLVHSLRQHDADANSSPSSSASPTPLIFHVFSNGGLAHLYNYVRVVESDTGSDAAALRIAGVLLDSCPGDITPFSGARAISASFSARPVRWLVYALCAVLFHLLGVAGWLLRLVGFGRLRFDNETIGHHLLAQAPALKHVPFLYLYSAGDTVVDCRFIRASAKRQRDAGVRVVVEREFEK
jgi:hypothetical protein